jgi:hypothetical protein
LRQRDRVVEACVGCERDADDLAPTHVNALLEEQSPLLEPEPEELSDEVPGDHGGHPGVYHELEDVTEALQRHRLIVVERCDDRGHWSAKPLAQLVE